VELGVHGRGPRLRFFFAIVSEGRLRVKAGPSDGLTSLRSPATLRAELSRTNEASPWDQ
jgi:hypothetical protein